MHNTPRNIEDKPYNACLDCANLGKICDGPNFLAMTIERWVEWCRMRKMYLGWTAQKLSDESGVALGTIERIFAGNTKDPLMSTVKLITKALVNGSWGQYPCADPNGEAAELAERCQQLQKELSDMTAKKDHFKTLGEDRLEMIKAKDTQIGAKDRQLDERANYLRLKDEQIGDLNEQIAELKAKNKKLENSPELEKQKKISRRLFVALCIVTILLIFALGTDSILRFLPWNV